MMEWRCFCGRHLLPCQMRFVQQEMCVFVCLFRFFLCLCSVLYSASFWGFGSDGARSESGLQWYLTGFSGVSYLPGDFGKENGWNLKLFDISLLKKAGHRKFTCISWGITLRWNKSLEKGYVYGS